MAATSARATQEYVPIKEVKDGIIVLKDGSLRALILTSSINFSLKSEEERQAVIYQFQNFLNSLDFSIQIFIQSRKLDIRPYIALMEQREKKQSNDLMRIQTKEYIEFIKDFTKRTNIMTKHFFIVIPYTPSIISNKSGGKLGGLKGLKGLIPQKKSATSVGEGDDFEEHRAQLQQRVSVVEQGLVQCGLRMSELGTDEVVELFYKIFNPGDAEKPIQLNLEQNK